MKKTIYWVTLCLFLTTSYNIMAQEKKSFSLDELLSGGGAKFTDLQPENLTLKWWGDHLVESKSDECAAVDIATGKRTTLFTLADAKQLTGSTSLSLRAVVFPYPNRTEALFTVRNERLLVDWKSKKILWKQTLPAGSTLADWNAASRNTAYVRDFNLYVQTADGKELAVSTDGSRELVYGQTVHRNEWGIDKGTFWNADGTLLAFYRMDQSMVTDYPQVNIAERIAVYEPDKYPMAGMTSHQVTIGIFSPATQQTVWLKTGEPVDRYFTNISWSADAKTLYLFELERSQKKSELVAYDVSTGERQGVLYTETNAKYVEPQHPLTFLPWNEKQFIFWSEKDGYRHLYLMDTNGKQLKQLTKGKFVVLELLGFKADSKSLIIRSTEDAPIQNNLYRIDWKTGKRTRLDAGGGVHRGTLSASGKFLFDTYSSPTDPRNIDLITVADSKKFRLLTAKDPWINYRVPEIVCGTLKAADDTTTLYYRMVKPLNFDSAKKYPTIVYVYGGPHARNVEASRNYAVRGWEIYMAQRGYLLFVLDNRGSKDRGFAFESVTHRHLGTEEMKDQMRGVDYLKSLPYVDSSRLGVYGWSFGGFMTTNLMLTYPDVFKVAVAGGAVIDWKFYEVMYGERYMETPEANSQGYDESNLNRKAGNLRGRLLMITGYNDPTVVPQHTLSFLRASEDAGTHPNFFVYPGQGHNMTGKDMVHLNEHITRYFDDFLK